MRQAGQERLTQVPLGWKAAARFVGIEHRHHGPARGQKWAVGCVDESGKLRGVAQAGRPVARHYDDGLTIEVNRTCTDGCPNANSFLYGVCWRISRQMGYHTSITYTQEGESGISLKAAGYRKVRDIEPRPDWFESSVKLRHKRNRGTGDVWRSLWVISARPWTEILQRFNAENRKAA